MVGANHWLRGIKTYRLSWYLIRFSANHASSNWALISRRHLPITSNARHRQKLCQGTSHSYTEQNKKVTKVSFNDSENYISIWRSLYVFHFFYCPGTKKTAVTCVSYAEKEMKRKSQTSRLTGSIAVWDALLLQSCLITGRPVEG